MKVARVMFMNSPRLYDYFVDFPCKEKDFLVVPAGDKFAVVRVKDFLSPGEAGSATKFALQKIDMHSYIERLHKYGTTVKEMLKP